MELGVNQILALEYNYRWRQHMNYPFTSGNRKSAQANITPFAPSFFIVAASGAPCDIIR